MDLTLTEDQEVIASAAREFLTPRRGGENADLWPELVKLGWPGLAVPEEYGGLGTGFLELCLLVEELGRAGVPSPLLTSSACCALPIARYGTEQQKAEWLGGIAEGRVLSYVRAAPRGHWGAEGSEVTATPDGDGFTLDGTALFVPYAADAEALLVLAEGPDGPVAVLCDAAVGVEPLETVSPDPLYRVEFSRVAVPAGRVLGSGGSGSSGAEVATAISRYGAAATCAAMVGGAQQVLDATVEYARTREQFGKPIGSFQAVQHHCADMAIDVLGARFMAYEAIWRLGTGDDAVTEVAAAKAWVSEAYQRVCALGHQVHGAIGFTAEHDLHHFFRHSVAAALAFGDSDHHTDQLARTLGL
ncbi:MAG: acyl-CoA dehydrogenase family protein [Micromonosporaceae bacterium]